MNAQNAYVYRGYTRQLIIQERANEHSLGIHALTTQQMVGERSAKKSPNLQTGNERLYIEPTQMQNEAQEG